MYRKVARTATLVAFIRSSVLSDVYLCPTCCCFWVTVPDHLYTVYVSNRPHFLWVYRVITHEGSLGKYEKALYITSPQASDLQTFRVFSQTSQVGYYPYKPIESVVYFLYIIMQKARDFSMGLPVQYTIIG